MAPSSETEPARPGRWFVVRNEHAEFDLTAEITRLGRDLQVCVFGGQQPHVGAVAVAQPRPSAKHLDKTSATASVVAILGHKEDQLARQAALEIAASTNATTVVTAGFHWEGLDDRGVEQVRRCFDELVRLVIARLVKERMLEPEGSHKARSTNPSGDFPTS